MPLDLGPLHFLDGLVGSEGSKGWPIESRAAQTANTPAQGDLCSGMRTDDGEAIPSTPRYSLQASISCVLPISTLLCWGGAH